jgi:hypothetical protein
MRICWFKVAQKTMRDEGFSSFGEYLRTKRQALAGRMATLTRIYLDTNFWLFARDAYAGRARNDTHRLLYEKLRRLVVSGRAICPASDIVLYEVFHQNDLGTRLITAQVIDELSAGIALESTKQRVRNEILHFLRSRREGTDALYRLSDWGWTRACWVLGEMHPYFRNVPPELQTRLQIGFCEEMTSRSIADLVTSLESAPEPSPRAFLDDLSRKLNDGKRHNAADIHSLKQAFAMEIDGVLDAHRSDIADALAYLSSAELVSDAAVEAEIADIKNLFRTERIGRSLPLFRWNREQKFKANDWLDYYHAGAALPYFDVFLTERSLASIVTSPTLLYDTLYGTRVCSDPTEALDLLEAV